MNLDSAILRQKIVRYKTRSDASDEEIAAHFGVPVTIVKEYLNVAKEIQVTYLNADIEVLRARELVKLDMAESEAWGAWAQSKKEVKTVTTTRSIVTDEGDKIGEETVTQVETGPGDPRYLALAVEASKHRRKLLGLDIPTEQRTPMRPGKGVTLTAAEQGQRVAELIEIARERRAKVAGNDTR